eukprot:4001518-Pleurochrysis_carterae.AAC.1
MSSNAREFCSEAHLIAWSAKFSSKTYPPYPVCRRPGVSYDQTNENNEGGEGADVSKGMSGRAVNHEGASGESPEVIALDLLRIQRTL